MKEKVHEKFGRFWNSITVIDKNGETIGDIIKMEHEKELIDPHDETGNIKLKNLYISLNRVLNILNEMNFKNVLLIDLSCSPTKLPDRTVRSISRAGPNQMAQGTKSKKLKRKKVKRKKTKKRRKKIKKNFN